jgi:hypothetical protein
MSMVSLEVPQRMQTMEQIAVTLQASLRFSQQYPQDTWQHIDILQQRRNPVKHRSIRQRTAILLTGLLMIATLRCPPAWGWGSEGHETIGAMADMLLAGTNAGQRVQALLVPGETLSTAAIWADCAKGFLYCQR